LSVNSKIHSKSIIAGDIFESVSWLQFSIMNFLSCSLVVKAKNTSNYNSTAVDFWFDDTDETFKNGKNGCILADLNKNIHIFILNEGESKYNKL